MICPVCTAHIALPETLSQRLARRMPNIELVPQSRRKSGRLTVAPDTVCGECDQTVPPSLADDRLTNVVIPIVGAPSASKTHLMGMLWQDLVRRQVLSKWCSNVRGERFEVQQIDQTLDLLIDMGEPMLGTLPVKRTDDGVRYLRPYYIQAGEHTVTMFDVAGEDFTNPKDKDATGWGPGLLAADGLIVVLDATDVLQGRAVGGEFVSRLAATVRRDRGIAPSRPLDIPILVLLGKADLLGDSLRGLDDLVREVDTELRGASVARVRQLSTTTLEQIGDRTVALLRSLGYDGEVAGIVNTFNPSRMLFLPQSAVGHDLDPETGRFPLPLNGYGNLTAAVWMLHQLGVIA